MLGSKRETVQQIHKSQGRYLNIKNQDITILPKPSNNSTTESKGNELTEM
jgi:hypothetical protein